MRPVIALLFLVLAFAAPAQAQRVEDADKLNLVVIGDVNSAPATWFRTDPNLRNLAAATHFTVLDPRLPQGLYAQRYRGKVVGQPPIVILERKDGGVIYAAHAGSMPSSGGQLYTDIGTSYKLAAKAKPTRDARIGALTVPDPAKQVQLAEATGEVPKSYLPEDCPDGVCPVPLDDGSDGMLPLLDRDGTILPWRDGDGMDWGPLAETRGGFLNDATMAFAVIAGGAVVVFLLGIGAIVVVAVLAVAVRFFR